MSKKIMLVVVVIMIFALLAVLFVLPGCKERAVAGLSESAIKLVDGEENTLELAGPVKKVVVLAPSVLEIIDALGAMEVVVEVDNYSITMNDPLVEGFEGAGDSYGPNVERIAELDPDILITVSGGPEDDYQKIRELGIEVYRTISIKGIEGIYDEIANVSKILGLEERGEKINGELKKGIDEIYSKVKDLNDDQRPRVFYVVWDDPLMSAGADTFINDLIEKSGGMNIVAEDNLTGWPEYSLEKLIEKNPDIIIAPMMAAVDSSVITGDKRFSSINAVVSNRVYVVPDNPVSRPNQNVIKALQMFAKAIHPEIFGEFEIIE
ncbi:MAG: ABC transporter substrate-binding protein [Actinobacteria bacterium]|nr:ABC transporter substrate-binding protein [Actinomycetota bacterium]